MRKKTAEPGLSGVWAQLVVTTLDVSRLREAMRLYKKLYWQMQALHVHVGHLSRETMHFMHF